MIPALGLIGGFLGWVFGRFRRGSGRNQTVSGGSVNVDGNVGQDVMTGGQKAEGGAVAVGGNVGGSLTIGYTPKDHDAALQRRFDELRADLEAKSIAMAHPDYATILNNLALLLRDMKRYEDAEPHFLDGLEILWATLGRDHPTTRKGEANYAAFLAERAATAASD